MHISSQKMGMEWEFELHHLLQQYSLHLLSSTVVLFNLTWLVGEQELKGNEESWTEYFCSLENQYHASTNQDAVAV